MGLSIRLLYETWRKHEAFGGSHVNVVCVSFLHTAQLFRYWGEGPTLQYTAFFCSSPLAFDWKLASRHISALVSELFTNLGAGVRVTSSSQLLCDGFLKLVIPGEVARAWTYYTVWIFFALTTICQLRKLCYVEWLVEKHVIASSHANLM
jgi:hypothetical protein